MWKEWGGGGGQAGLQCWVDPKRTTFGQHHQPLPRLAPPKLTGLALDAVRDARLCVEIVAHDANLPLLNWLAPLVDKRLGAGRGGTRHEPGALPPPRLLTKMAGCCHPARAISSKSNSC